MRKTFKPLALSLVAAWMATGALAQDPFCNTNARAWQQIAGSRGDLGPGDVAQAYLDLYASTRFSREAQDVWMRMRRDGQSLPDATEAHLERYHSSKAEDARRDLGRRIRGELRTAATTYDMIAFFEGYRLTQDEIDARIEKVLKKRGVDAGKYTAQAAKTAERYRAKGIHDQEALLRGYVEAWNSYELESGMLGIDRLKPGTPCYRDALFKRDSFLRSEALEAHPLGQQGNPSSSMSKLDYFTSGLYGHQYIMYRGHVWNAAGS